MTTATIDDDPDLDLEPPSPRRRRWLWATLGMVVAAGAGAGYWYAETRDGSASSAPQANGPVATAEVTRETLVASETFEGTLGHGEAVGVTAAAPGVVTRIAAAATDVSRGTELYRLDEHPVTALIGAVPMYRDLSSGAVGSDVEQLEANLVALGYDGFTVDDEYTDTTAEAVRAWQDDRGLDETGIVRRADVVFLPAAGRVDVHQADVGDAVSPGQPVLEVTGTDQVVSLDVDLPDRDLLPVAAAVSITLPGGEQVAGTVTAVSVVEAAGDGNAEGGELETGADAAVAQVEVAVAAPVDATLVGSPVDVVVAVDERPDVLVVPVNALLALSGGGYGLETVADDGTTSIVAVETGMFAGGKVEVTGSGVAEGTVVGVAGR